MPGATLFLQNSQDVRIGGRQGNAQYQYTLQAPDFATLAVWGPKVLDRLSAASGNRRRQLRSAELRSVLKRHHRSRYRVAPGADRAGRGFRALRRLWPAPGVGDVQVDQSVSRRPRLAAAVVEQSQLPEYRLRADAARSVRALVHLYALHAGHHADFAARTRASFRQPPIRSISRKGWRSATRWIPSIAPKWKWACRRRLPASLLGPRRLIRRPLPISRF